jgi:hypothetical protein
VVKSPGQVYSQRVKYWPITGRAGAVVFFEQATPGGIAGSSYLRTLRSAVG